MEQFWALCSISNLSNTSALISRTLYQTWLLSGGVPLCWRHPDINIPSRQSTFHLSVWPSFSALLMSFFLWFLPFWISFPFTSLFHLLLWRLTFLPSLALSLCVSTSFFFFLQFSKFSSSGSLFMSLTEHIYTPRCPPLHLLNSFQLNFLVKLTDTFEVFRKSSFFNWGKKWFNNKDIEESNKSKLRFCPWVFYPLGFLVFEVFSIIIFGSLWILVQHSVLLEYRFMVSFLMRCRSYCYFMPSHLSFSFIQLIPFCVLIVSPQLCLHVCLLSLCVEFGCLHLCLSGCYFLFYFDDFLSLVHLI